MALVPLCGQASRIRCPACSNPPPATLTSAMKRLALVVTLIAASLGCGGEGSPSAPSALPGPQPAPAAAAVPAAAVRLCLRYRLPGGRGRQGRGAERPACRSGHDVGRLRPFLLRPGRGQSLDGAGDQGWLRRRHTDLGFLTDGRAYVSFSLASINPPVAIAGSYTLTITADSTCAALPDDVRTRTYPATVTAATTSTVPANTRFDGRVTGGQFAPFLNLFWIGVFGDYVNISTEGEGPSLAEHLGGNRYVAYYGSGAASVGTGLVSTISVPFAGTIEYASSPRRSARITTAARPWAPCGASAGRPAIS